MIIFSFGLFLLLFVVIGVLSSLQHRNTNLDYLLAGHSVKPWLVALSAVATNNSGYMFVGMIGYTYTFGLSSIWLMIGWILGDFIASLLIHKHLRIKSESQKAMSFSAVLSKWHGTNFRTMQVIGGIMTLVFLGAYAAAQLSAGSKALHVLFGWDYSIGAIMGAIIVMLYCFAGGIRASIWTDAAQSIVMILAMGTLFWISLETLGGFGAYVNKLAAVSPTYLSLFPQNIGHPGLVNTGLFILGWVFAGFGVVGQPHIMVRFMAMDQPENMARTRLYYYSWYTAFYCMTIAVGLAARILLPEASNFDAELALPTLAQQLLPEVLVGLILAGLFAATMSTADSQILSCSAVITRDFFPNKLKYIFTKLATVFVTMIALGIALMGNKSVFSLVLIAWSALASVFGPLLFVYAFRQRPSQKLAIAMMLGGLASVLLWRQLGYGAIVYEIMPGMLAGGAIFLLGKQLGWCLPGTVTAISEAKSLQTKKHGGGRN